MNFNMVDIGILAYRVLLLYRLETLAAALRFLSLHHAPYNRTSARLFSASGPSYSLLKFSGKTRAVNC